MPRIAAIVCATFLTCAPFGVNAVHATDTTDTTVPQSPDSTFVYDLEREPADCIGFLPKPGCGKKPEQAGDRGGSLQYLTFGIMIAGLATIGTVLVRNVVKRDRAMADRLKDPQD
jgi:hypothetical protein